jgi:hypothetical protein
MRCSQKRARLILTRGRAVRAEVPAIHVGRGPVRDSSFFTVGTANAINATYCKRLHRADGYGYVERPALPPPTEAGGLQPGRLG